VIRAVGQQWRWTLDRDSVRVGELVEFQVTADDVNHGFAIYQGKSRIIAASAGDARVCQQAAGAIRRAGRI
jgi:heme/copper-type cytochrome/quinol oxidase subunit 2